MSKKEWIQFCQFRDCNEIAVENPKNKILYGWSVNIFHCPRHEPRCEFTLDLLEEDPFMKDKLLK